MKVFYITLIYYLSFCFSGQRKDLTVLNDVHKRKAAIFYERKCLAKKNARQRSDLECICMDYTQNLPCPNIATNDTYYRPKLGFYMFNVHILSNNGDAFYTYNETRGKREQMMSFPCYTTSPL